MRRLFAIIVAAIAFIGCTMDDITVSYQTDKSDIYYASFEDFGEESRTYVDENVKLLWHEDDRISLFRTTLNEQFKFTGATGDNSGGFSAIPSDEWVTGNVVSTNYAVYPYDATTKLSNDEIIQLTMPAVQHYAENSFGRGANTMVAASENTSSKFLPFRNLGGYIIVKLYGEDTTIKSIEFKGNNEEVIAGAATAEAKYGYLPVVTMSESGTTTITLDCGEEGVTISSDSANPTSFWFVVPPITFEGGFTFTITDINGNTFTKSTTKSQTVVRNEVKSMSGFEPTFEGEGEDPEVATKPANNEIWYTNGSTTEPTAPRVSTAFGSANIVSNTYDNKKECWVIKFDGEVTEIGDMAFYNCTSLKNITIPNSVTNIGYRGFSGCTSLKSIIIPESVKEIEGGTFRDCTSLTNVTIPDSVTNIGDLAFSDCTSLTNVTIPDSVTSIGNSAFICCTSLTSVDIPDSVTSIGGCAFQGCFLLKSITIPNSITTIEDYTFYGCSFTSVTIPDSVTKIGERNPFSYCTNLAKFEGKFAANNGRCLIKDNVIISYANASGAEYTIPDSVTSIGNSAFFGCTSLTSVNIPDSVTTIGEWAFMYCASLTSVTIPDSVTEIGSSTFTSCSSLTSVYCNPTTPPTGTSMFQDNASDLKIYVPMESVDAYKSAWSDYASFIVGYNFETGEIVIPSVYPANNEIWYTNGSTTTATTPYKTDFGGATIQSNTYNSNDECWVIKFDKDITAIGYEAFKFCSNLESVYIPTSVELIDGDAFYNCSSLKEVYCMPTTPPNCRYGAFPFDSTIYVPSASVSAYKSAPEYWNYYTDKIVGYDF